MILAIRKGSSLRRVAKRFGVSHTTVCRWVKRTAQERLDRADFADRISGARAAANRTPRQIERMVLSLRRRLKEQSALGEHGACAIRTALLDGGIRNVPSVRTIGRILQRHGLLDGRQRVRRPPPPKGWYLPGVAAGRAEIDSFDTITDLVIQGGQPVTVLNVMSLHGGLSESWPESRITAKTTVLAMLEHWRKFGLPAYAKFDNDQVFRGAQQWADSFGRVIRTCLQLGVVPVFAPPREPGFQAEIEAYNGRWQRSVWRKRRHRDLAGLCVCSRRFVTALRERSAQRIEAAPARRPMPEKFKVDYRRELTGSVIFLRRTDPKGIVECLGHRWLADENWVHRLVRIEVNLSVGRVSIHALRRREPGHQPLLKSFGYRVPKKVFKE